MGSDQCKLVSRASGFAREGFGQKSVAKGRKDGNLRRGLTAEDWKIIVVEVACCCTASIWMEQVASEICGVCHGALG
jgi:hypothetical protein